MNIHEGIALLVNADSSVTALSPIGGWVLRLPKDYTVPCWTQHAVYDVPDTGLQYVRGLSRLCLEIKCYDEEMNRGAKAIRLADAIDNVLAGFSGALPNGLFVSSCLPTQNRGHDEEHEGRRLIVRVLEYELLYSTG